MPGPRGGHRGSCPQLSGGHRRSLARGRRRQGRGRTCTLPRGPRCPARGQGRPATRHAVMDSVLATDVPGRESVTAGRPLLWAAWFHRRRRWKVARACRPDAGDRAVHRGTVTVGVAFCRCTRCPWRGPVSGGGPSVFFAHGSSGLRGPDWLAMGSVRLIGARARRLPALHTPPAGAARQAMHGSLTRDFSAMHRRGGDRRWSLTMSLEGHLRPRAVGPVDNSRCAPRQPRRGAPCSTR